MSKPRNLVLLIDDEPKIRRFLHAGFEIHGFSVVEAEKYKINSRGARPAAEGSIARR